MLLKVNKKHTQVRKTKMVILRYTTCLVLGLLFTSLALRNSAVHAQQAAYVATGADAVFVSKELFGGLPAAISATANKRLGGRKLILGSILMNNMMEEEAANGKKTAKISGEDRNTSKKLLGTSQKYKKDQKSSNLWKPKALNSEHSSQKENPWSKPADLPDTMASQLKFQDSEAVSNCGSLECSSRSRKLVSPDYHDHFHKAESKKLLEAANQIVSLIHKDYSGFNMPRRMPPINNHEPLSQNP